MSNVQLEMLFQCPGETQPISRSVHLARLAAGFAPCRECEHRQNFGMLPSHIRRRAMSQQAKVSRPLISPLGIRGLYLNDFTRESLSRVAEHALDLVDEERFDSSDPEITRRRLRVAVGYDGRPASPDLSLGVVGALRRWGCEIADVGAVSRPAFDYALERVHPDLGFFVTGGSQSSAWTGLDILDKDGLPWCWPGKLQRLHSRLSTPPARTARTHGKYQLVSIADDYEEALAHQFHAIRPLRVVISCLEPIVTKTLRHVLERTPCAVDFLDLLGTPEPLAQRRILHLKDALSGRHADLGILIGLDGRTCQIVDEHGTELTTSEMMALMSLVSLDPGHSQSASEVAASQAETPAFESEVELMSCQRQSGTPVISDGSGRYWWLHESPQCDAIQTVAKTLQALSLSERPVSSYRRPRERRVRSRR